LPKLKVNSIKFSKSSRLNVGKARERAAALAGDFLLYLSEDQKVLARFIAETGYDPVRLRGSIGQPEFVDATFHYLCSDEAALIGFASRQGVDPVAIHSLWQALAGGSSFDD
jgi:Protein of unknown function (DUF3572)